MSGPQLRGFSWRMEWIGEQQKTFDQSGVRSGKQAGLAASVGTAAEERASGRTVLSLASRPGEGLAGLP